ncbi:MAG: phosphodiester glycosidase family protein [Lentisphaerae bacterium]|nr:phosphodiester glycosidase family protein [Lentisphaerota bacterium]
MKKTLFVLLFAIVSQVLCAEWWNEKKADWNKAKELVPGIVYMHEKRTSPRLMEIWLMRIDLSRKFNFHTAKKAADYGKPMPTHPDLQIHTLRQRTVDFMSEAQKNNVNMVAAINASPWGPWDKTPSPHATRLGLLVSDGVVVSPVRPKNRPTLLFYRDGTIDLRVVGENEDLSQIWQAVTSYHRVLTDGRVTTIGGDYLAPRTGIGLTADKKYLYFMVIDGRQPGFSMGCTIREVGLILKYMGADNGVNMDGGGSSSFVIWDTDKKQPVMLNHQPLGGIRAVASSLGISVPEKERKNE